MYRLTEFIDSLKLSKNYHGKRFFNLPRIFLKYCNLQCEDEWSDIKQRFEKEGIDYNRLKTEDKLIHVWRWLVDADINLQNARKMIEKLRLKQSEELEVSFIIILNVPN